MALHDDDAFDSMTNDVDSDESPDLPLENFLNAESKFASAQGRRRRRANFGRKMEPKRIDAQEIRKNLRVVLESKEGFSEVMRCVENDLELKQYCAREISENVEDFVGWKTSRRHMLVMRRRCAFGYNLFEILLKDDTIGEEFGEACWRAMAGDQEMAFRILQTKYGACAMKLALVKCRPAVVQSLDMTFVLNCVYCPFGDIFGEAVIQVIEATPNQSKAVFNDLFDQMCRGNFQFFLYRRFHFVVDLMRQGTNSQSKYLCDAVFHVSPLFFDLNPWLLRVSCSETARRGLVEAQTHWINQLVLDSNRLWSWAANPQWRDVIVDLVKCGSLGSTELVKFFENPRAKHMFPQLVAKLASVTATILATTS